MKKFLLLCVASVALSACSELEYASHLYKWGSNDGTANTSVQEGTFKVGKPYKVEGQWYYPKEQYDHEETGIASWYGPGFHGKKTANGEVFNTNELTAAHRTLQMPSLVRVTNLDNGKSVIVRINDRGPFARSRVIDVSEKAATLLDFKNKGTAKVKLQVLKEESIQMAQAARRGVDTGKASYQTAALDSTTPTAVPQLAVERVSAEQLVPVPMHVTGATVYPDPIVTQVPVSKTSIYVQAGSFSIYENAQKQADLLASLGKVRLSEANINGKQFYRVQVGPIADVARADQMLASVVGKGHQNAIIVVE